MLVLGLLYLVKDNRRGLLLDLRDHGHAAPLLVGVEHAAVRRRL